MFRKTNIMVMCPGFASSISFGRTAAKHSLQAGVVDKVGTVLQYCLLARTYPDWLADMIDDLVRYPLGYFKTLGVYHMKSARVSMLKMFDIDNVGEEHPRVMLVYLLTCVAWYSYTGKAGEATAMATEIVSIYKERVQFEYTNEGRLFPRVGIFWKSRFAMWDKFVHDIIDQSLIAPKEVHFCGPATTFEVRAYATRIECRGHHLGAIRRHPPLRNVFIPHGCNVDFAVSDMIMDDNITFGFDLENEENHAAYYADLKRRLDTQYESSGYVIDKTFMEEMLSDLPDGDNVENPKEVVPNDPWDSDDLGFLS
jgi:hypothetical protein